MRSLPDPRADGLCVDCGKKKAVTYDGRWCRSCLLKRIHRDIPIKARSRRTEDQREEISVTKYGHGQR